MRSAPKPTTRQPALGIPAAEEIAEFIRAVIDRSAAYHWPPAERALARGEPVRPTRRGWAVFYQWRREHRPPLDLRAVELEAARAPQLFAGSNGTPAPATEGLTIQQFAEWAGVDHRRVSQHLEVIPPGPVPPLPAGKVPARQVGNTVRIFARDFRGEQQKGERFETERAQEAPASSAGGTDWHRQIARLRDRSDQR